MSRFAPSKPGNQHAVRRGLPEETLCVGRARSCDPPSRAVRAPFGKTVANVHRGRLDSTSTRLLGLSRFVAIQPLSELAAALCAWCTEKHSKNGQFIGPRQLLACTAAYKFWIKTVSETSPFQNECVSKVDSSYGALSPFRALLNDTCQVSHARAALQPPHHRIESALVGL